MACVVIVPEVCMAEADRAATVARLDVPPIVVPTRCGGKLSVRHATQLSSDCTRRPNCARDSAAGLACAARSSPVRHPLPSAPRVASRRDTARCCGRSAGVARAIRSRRSCVALRARGARGQSEPGEDSDPAPGGGRDPAHAGGRRRRPACRRAASRRPGGHHPREGGARDRVRQGHRRARRPAVRGFLGRGLPRAKGAPARTGRRGRRRRRGDLPGRQACSTASPGRVFLAAQTPTHSSTTARRSSFWPATTPSCRSSTSCRDGSRKRLVSKSRVWSGGSKRAGADPQGSPQVCQSRAHPQAAASSSHRPAGRPQAIRDLLNATRLLKPVLCLRALARGLRSPCPGRHQRAAGPVGPAGPAGRTRPRLM